MSRRYYEEEMRYLLEAGKAFAKAHPAQARLLNIDSITDRDPYVERLFEGFAFLTGRIRERLDDEVPEYTQGLFQLLYPHYLRPFPSCAILAFSPRPGLVQETMVIERGAEVRSQPVGKESAVCRFTTTQPVRLHPIRLADAALQWDRDGASSVTLRFKLDRGVDFSKLDLNPLRLYLHAAPSVASAIHLFFTRHLQKMAFRAEGTTFELHGQQWVQPGGFAPDEGVVPYLDYSFPGFRLLHEYFLFRNRFWFVDLFGFNRFKPPAKAGSFELQLFFNRTYPENQRFKTENLKLYCTPIVNLFQKDGEPVRTEHRVAEYLVVPSIRHRNSIRPYSVDTVVGLEERTGQRWNYRPYFSFSGSTENPRTYNTTTREGPGGLFETYLSLNAPGIAAADAVTETVSLDLTCTNGGLPREALKEGSIRQASPGIPSVADLENLTQPTLELAPPVREHPAFLWTLLSHLSLNHMSVVTREGLTSILSLYDWSGTEANRRRLAGIKKVSWTPVDHITRGAVMRGMEVTVEVGEGAFEDEGDLCLFGRVLSEFLTLYATLNSFVHLTIRLTPSGTLYEWKPIGGKQAIV